MNTALKRTLLSTLVAPLALGAASASAELITEWGYSADSSFTAWNASSGNPADITPDDVDGDTDTDKLSWGIPSSRWPLQSSISITDVDSPDGLVTNAPGYVDGGVFTHTNRYIDASDPALTTFTLQSVLTLTPFDPMGAALAPQMTSFNGFFKETRNLGGTCVIGSATVCDDVFTLGNVDALGGTPTTDGYGFEQSFDFDGYTYTVFLELAGLVGLLPDACAAAGAPAGCVGFLTEEDNVNNFTTRFSISAVKNVPEPGTLALLGLGLAGLGLSRRKKAAKA